MWRRGEEFLTWLLAQLTAFIGLSHEDRHSFLTWRPSLAIREITDLLKLECKLFNNIFFLFKRFFKVKFSGVHIF